MFGETLKYFLNDVEKAAVDSKPSSEAVFETVYPSFSIFIAIFILNDFIYAYGLSLIHISAPTRPY